MKNGLGHLVLIVTDRITIKLQLTGKFRLIFSILCYHHTKGSREALNKNNCTTWNQFSQMQNDLLGN